MILSGSSGQPRPVTHPTSSTDQRLRMCEGFKSLDTPLGAEGKDEKQQPTIPEVDCKTFDKLKN